MTKLVTEEETHVFHKGRPVSNLSFVPLICYLYRCSLHLSPLLICGDISGIHIIIHSWEKCGKPTIVNILGTLVTYCILAIFLIVNGFSFPEIFFMAPVGQTLPHRVQVYSQ